MPASTAPTAGKPNFDGAWSVLIVTEKGTCDRAYRYPIKIENGTVDYAGSASFTVTGKVGANGAVTVTVVARQPERQRHRPHVAERRLRPLADRGRRMLGHLERGEALVKAPPTSFLH